MEVLIGMQSQAREGFQEEVAFLIDPWSLRRHFPGGYVFICLNLIFLNCTMGITIASLGGGYENYMKFTHSSHKYL